MGIIEGSHTENVRKDMFGQTYMINGRNPEAEAILRYHRCHPTSAKIEDWIEAILCLLCVALMIGAIIYGVVQAIGH